MNNYRFNLIIFIVVKVFERIIYDYFLCYYLDMNMLYGCFFIIM